MNEEKSPLFLQFLLEINHLYGCYGTFITLVSQAAAGTVFSLLHVVGGNQAIDNRDVCGSVQVSDALGGTGTYIVKVRSVSRTTQPMAITASTLPL